MIQSVDMSKLVRMADKVLSEKNKHSEYNSPSIPMDVEDLSNFDNSDILEELDNDENIEYIRSLNNIKKKKKKKEKKELTPEKIKRIEDKKAKKKAEAEARLKAQQIHEAEKAARKFEKKKKESEIEVIQLLARKEFLQKKLHELNPGKEKDARKIAAINIEFKEITERIESLQSEYGIHVNSIDTGSKVSRFFKSVKTKCRKGFKKVKKFFRNNTDLIYGLGSVVLPFVGAFIIKVLSK